MDSKKIIIFSVALFGFIFSPSLAMANEEFFNNHYAEIIKQDIDDSVASEMRKGAPNGHIGEGYSYFIWNEYWNDRIYYLYGFEKKHDSYEGPSGLDFIRYLIEERRKHGLPELRLESRNKDRVPFDLIL